MKILKLAAVGLMAIGLFANCLNEQMSESTTEAESLENGISRLQGNGSYNQVSSFGSNPGALNMYLYEPTDAPANAPVVVVFHGCLMTAAQMEPSGWTNLADEWGFYVIFPEQVSGNNPAQCFNWAGEYGDTTNLIRNQGENKSIISMVNYVKSNFSVDNNRVFTVGFSAGGAMVPVMLATWPDVFAGGAIFAGVPYWCETSVQGAFDCMSPGKNKTPNQWGDLVRNAYSSYSGPYPKVSIWHGSSDSTVVPFNQTELIDQWTNVHGIDQTADVTDSIEGYTREQFQNGVGETLVESIVIPGMGHAVPIDPQASQVSGCGQTGAYIEDKNICAPYYVGKFFGLDNSDQVPPTITITSPSNAASVSGTVTVTANASDNVAVDKVELYVDGELKDTDTSAPYSLTFDSSLVFNGDRIVIAKAYDAAGNSTPDQITVTVSGGIDDTFPPVVTADPSGGTFTGTLNVSLSANEEADIYYTTDGSTPTETSAVYSTTIQVSDTTTLKFFGVDTSDNSSSVITEQYDKLSYEETIDGTCTTHYVAGRLDTAGYTACGSTYGYIDSVTMYRFGTCWSFDIAGAGCDPGGGGGDTTAPTVNVTAPASSSTVSGNITITADASDNEAVTKVEFYVAGNLITTDTSAPYSTNFDTTTIANGSVGIEAKAFDAAGNTAIDNDTSVTVDNGGGGTNCTEESDFNYYHKLAGRAYSTGNPWAPDYFAEGSDDTLAGSTWGSNILHSNDGGTIWNAGGCP